MAGPTIRRVQLGAELRRLREAAGMSRPEAAAAIKTSKSRLAAIELGRNVVSFSELIVLLRDHYHGTDEQLATLEEIREEASQRGWWSTYALPEGLSTYVGLESPGKYGRFGVKHSSGGMTHPCGALRQAERVVEHSAVDGNDEAG